MYIINEAEKETGKSDMKYRFFLTAADFRPWKVGNNVQQSFPGIFWGP
jgi:hypothetical protein